MLVVMLVLVSWPARVVGGEEPIVKKAPPIGKKTVAGVHAAGDFYFASDEPAYLEFVGSALWRDHYKVVVDGEYAFVAMINGLRILDIGDPAHPQLIVNYDLPEGQFSYIALAGSEVFLAGRHTVYRIDVSDVYHPETVTSYSVDGVIRGFDVGGDFAYLSFTQIISLDSLAYGLQALDLGGGEIQLVAQYPYTGFVDVAGNLLVTANELCDFVMLDISDPRHVTELSCVQLEGSWNPVLAEIADTLVSVSVSEYISPSSVSALEIYNIKDPAHPVRVASIPFENDVYNCVVRGNLIYAANSFWGVQVVDITNPAVPEIIGHYLNPGYLYHIAIVDSVLYGCDAWPISGFETVYDTSYWGGAAPGDFLTVDIADPTDPQILGYYRAPAQVSRIVSGGNRFAFCLNSLDSIGADVQIVDLSNPASPLTVGSYSSNRGAGLGGCAAENYFYLATGPGGLEIIDITEKNGPAMVSVCEGGAGAQDVIVINDYAFVANGASGVWIWDVSDAVSPKFIRSFPVTEAAVSLAAGGGYLYVTGGDIHIFDISDPEFASAGPVVSGYGDCGSLAIAEEKLFAATSDGYIMFDIGADPEHPALISQVSAGVAADDIAFYNGFVVLSCGGEGIFVYDIDESPGPERVGIYNTPGNATGIFIDSNMVYIADTRSLIVAAFPQSMGVDEPPHQIPDYYSLRQNYPNPFNPVTSIEYIVSKRSAVTLTVFNMLGQSVRTLVDDIKPAGTYTVRWDGTDAFGDRLASGVYLYRIRIGDYSETREMVLLK